MDALILREIDLMICGREQEREESESEERGRGRERKQSCQPHSGKLFLYKLSPVAKVVVQVALLQTKSFEMRKQKNCKRERVRERECEKGESTDASAKQTNSDLRKKEMKKTE